MKLMPYCHAMATRPRTIASPQPPFVAHCVELLAPLGPVRVRRMFGGWGLYVDEVFIALIALERLYLKADAHSAPRFEAAGSEPFRFEAHGEVTITSYWAAPAEALDSPPLMEPWARLAMQSALSARAAKAPKNKAPKPAAAPALKPTTLAASRRRIKG